MESSEDLWYKCGICKKSVETCDIRFHLQEFGSGAKYCFANKGDMTFYPATGNIMA